MDDEEFMAALHEAARAAITTYRTDFPEGPPITEVGTTETGNTETSSKEIHARFRDLTAFYDELFDVDSTPYRDAWHDHLVYDCTGGERLRLLTSDLPHSLSLVFIGGRYASSTGHIGVSPDRLPRARAYSVLASELCHAYQDRFESPTWTHPYALEGFEQAASCRALDHLASTGAEDTTAQTAAKERARVLLQGTLAHGTRRGGISPTAVRELGVTDEELDDLRSDGLWRALGALRPRYRWGSAAVLPDYDLLGSLLLVSEREGVADVYARAFRGEHPWESLVADIRSVSPSWLWRLVHS